MGLQKEEDLPLEVESKGLVKCCLWPAETMGYREDFNTLTVPGSLPACTTARIVMVRGDASSETSPPIQCFLGSYGKLSKVLPAFSGPLIVFCVLNIYVLKRHFLGGKFLLHRDLLMAQAWQPLYKQTSAVDLIKVLQCHTHRIWECRFRNA